MPAENGPLFQGLPSPFLPDLARTLKAPQEIDGQAVKISNHITKALMLAHIHELVQASTFRWNGRNWVKHSREYWFADHFPYLSTGTVQKLLEDMQADGLILRERQEGESVQAPYWITIDYDFINSLQIPNRPKAKTKFKFLPPQPISATNATAETSINSTLQQNVSDAEIQAEMFDAVPDMRLDVIAALVGEEAAQEQTPEQTLRDFAHEIGVPDLTFDVVGDYWEKDKRRDEAPPLICLDYLGYRIGNHCGFGEGYKLPLKVRKAILQHFEGIPEQAKTDGAKKAWESLLEEEKGIAID